MRKERRVHGEEGGGRRGGRSGCSRKAGGRVAGGRREDALVEKRPFVQSPWEQ
jgi:hypothetical protein